MNSVRSMRPRSAASPCSAWWKGSTPTRTPGELVFHVFGAIAHFERRLIAERTKDGIAAARARGKRPGCRPLDADKIAAALSLVKAGLSPTAAAKQLGFGRSTVYREVSRAGIERTA
jgi:DNA invertase Pin-like site-specific DNA recombinase